MIAALFARLAKWAGIPDPRILGAILLIWAGTLLCLAAYMEGRATSVAETARAEALADCNAAKALAAKEARQALEDAVAKARADWAKAQAEVDAAAAADRAKIQAEVDAQRDRAENLFRQLQAHIHANPLPDTCRLDPVRVRLFNEARRTAKPGTGTDRPGL
jgi:hypothetical protein